MNPRFPLALAALLGAAVAVSAHGLAACNLGTSLGDVDAGPVDAGPVLISCTQASDCPIDAPECSFGICKRPCASSSGCVDPQTYCNLDVGYCEPGCRDSSACGDGEVCSAGVCIQSAGCASKCDCATGQVCVGGSCQDPPQTCAGPQDCGRGANACEEFACNGFTQQCFDLSPEACSDDADCVGRPGCAEGCVCNALGQCAAAVACTPENEAQVCSAGQFCLNGRCEVALCNNGGVTCGAGQSCGADGRCTTAGNGAPCTSDNHCPPNQYCSLVAGQGGQCANGCRDNSSCSPGQQCNGDHQCVGGGLRAAGEPCVGANGDPDDSLCQQGLVCDPVNGVCAESCAGFQRRECDGQAGCCVLTGKPCCNLFFLCSDGFAGNCLEFD